jgi:hypothetical protein
MFTAPLTIPPEELERAAQQWASANWVRIALVLGAWLATQASEGNARAYDYATTYAQWGNTPKALEWLETALQLREPQLIDLKTDPLLDPLRQEPRFQAIERELKFPP